MILFQDYLKGKKEIKAPYSLATEKLRFRILKLQVCGQYGYVIFCLIKSKLYTMANSE